MAAISEMSRRRPITVLPPRRRVWRRAIRSRTTHQGRMHPMPVRNECQLHELRFPEKFGIWGGMSEDDRVQILGARLDSDRRPRRLSSAARTRSNGDSAPPRHR